MSRTMLVGCLIAIASVGTAVAQTQCPQPKTRVAQVQPNRVDLSTDNVTFTSPMLNYYVSTRNAMGAISSALLKGNSGSTQVSDTTGTYTVLWSTTFSGTSATTTVSGLPPNATVESTVTVIAPTCTQSQPSAPVVAITPPSPPTGISGLGGLQKVTVSWQPAAGAASYQLTLSNGMSFTTTATSYIVTGLQTATSYNVIVASINSAGQRGAFSPVVAVRTANVALQ